MIKNLISKYHTLSRSENHHRFRSWEHCFRFFQKHKGDFHNPELFDLACLNLAFYLASWGMLRGSTFLFQKDYRVHEYLIRDVIMNPSNRRYHILAASTEMEDYNGIERLFRDISGAYIKNIKTVDGEPKTVTVSDTLISKIILGIYGCIPAYDRYFIEGLKIHGIKPSLSENSIKQLLSFLKNIGMSFNPV